ncbi:MAG: hypothetical protein AAB303_00005, partial [Chloroflexota bacterium]
MSDIRLCGAANLVAAILGEDPNKVKAKLGLPVPTCARCGEPSPVLSREGLCQRCYHDFIWIEVACDECGRLFRRRGSVVIFEISKRGYSHQFCNRICFARWMTKHRPPQIGCPGKRKHDYDL